MSSDHDKLLSEGPRSAPEPLTADGFSAPTPVQATPVEPVADRPIATPEPTVTPEPIAAKPPLVKAPSQGSRPSSAGGSWLTGSLLRRLIPLLLVLVVVGRGFVGRHSSSWAFALIWVGAAVVILFLRMRGRRPW